MLESFFNKFADLQACNFIKTRFQHRCFPKNIAKFLEHLFWRTSANVCFCEVYSEPNETSKMELFAKIIYAFNPITISIFNPLITNVLIIQKPVRANQLNGFYMMGTLVVKGLIAAAWETSKLLSISYNGCFGCFIDSLLSEYILLVTNFIFTIHKLLQIYCIYPYRNSK